MRKSSRVAAYARKQGIMSEQCAHNVIRKKRNDREHGQYEFDAYVCGTCATIFEVNVHVPPLLPHPEPLGQKIPWGLRDRQA